MEKEERQERWKTVTFDILSVKKKALEANILKLCNDFEKDVGLEIEGILMTTVDPIMKGKGVLLRKLLEIEIKLAINL